MKYYKINVFEEAFALVPLGHECVFLIKYCFPMFFHTRCFSSKVCNEECKYLNSAGNKANSFICDRPMPN